MYCFNMDILLLLRQGFSACHLLTQRTNVWLINLSRIFEIARAQRAYRYKMVCTHTYRLYVCSSQNMFWTEHAKAPTNTVHNCLFLQIFFSQLQPSANPGLSATERWHFGARCMSRRQSFWNGFVHPLEHPLRQSFRPELRTVLMICRRTWCSHMDKSKNGGHQSKDTLCFRFLSQQKNAKGRPSTQQWWPIWTDYLLRISFQVHPMHVKRDDPIPMRRFLRKGNDLETNEQWTSGSPWYWLFGWYTVHILLYLIYLQNAALCGLTFCMFFFSLDFPFFSRNLFSLIFEI